MAVAIFVRRRVAADPVINQRSRGVTCVARPAGPGQASMAPSWPMAPRALASVAAQKLGAPMAAKGPRPRWGATSSYNHGE